MKAEVTAAVVFLSQLVLKKANLPKDRVEKFQNNLIACLLERFKDHWYDGVPTKGQGYRCIRINNTEPVDPVLENAANNCGLKVHDLALPNEFTLWVDPSEVTCRLGENHGSYTLIAQFREGSSENLARTPDIDRLLQNHIEKMEVEQAKFRIATSTRSNVRSPSSRHSSPPTYKNYEPSYLHPSCSWEAHSNVYPGSEGFLGNNEWNSWGPRDNSPSLSPNSNTQKGRHSGRHVRMSHGRQTSFSNHPSERMSWNKAGIVAKA